MEIRHLRYFLAVVDEGGVNRAAEALHVAQPSLSQALRKFESMQGTQLFHRIGRGLVLSPAGEALVGPARMILREVEEAESALRDIKTVRKGRVDIATLSDISTEPLSIWIGQFRAQHPEVSFRISEHDSVTSVVRTVQQGLSEVGVIPHPIGADNGLSEQFVVRQQFVLALPPALDGFPDGPVTVSGLAELPLVMGASGDSTASHIIDHLRHNGIEPRIAVEAPHRGALMRIVAANGGAAIVPLRIAVETARHRGIIVRELSPPLTRELGMIRRHSRMTEAASAFLHYSQKLLQQWYGSLERHSAQGLDLVSAGSQTVSAIDRNIRRRRVPVPKPLTDQ